MENNLNYLDQKAPELKRLMTEFTKSKDVEADPNEPDVGLNKDRNLTPAQANKRVWDEAATTVVAGDWEMTNCTLQDLALDFEDEDYDGLEPEDMEWPQYSAYDSDDEAIYEDPTGFGRM
ncbi:expressed unknown protein (Partial), partial [Seminavis robusta]|eukprot:Sro3027_g342370.1 n/a (119) ;mRNA; f:1905-2261